MNDFTNIKDILTYGGVSVAVIIALMFFLNAMSNYNKSQTESMIQIIEAVDKNKWKPIQLKVGVQAVRPRGIFNPQGNADQEGLAPNYG